MHYALTLLLLALPLAGQVRVNSAKSVTTGTAVTATINYTAASAGNLLVVMCAASNAGNPQITALLMSGGGHTWVEDQFINDKTNGEAFSVYHAFAANTSAQTLTCTSGAPGGGNLAVAKGFVVAVLEYSGYAANYIGDGSTPFTVINKLSDSTAVSIGPIQTANANALLISAFHTDDDSADCITSVNGSWTLVQSNDDAQLSPCAGIMERIVSVTGDYSASATVATSKWVTGIMVYVPTASTPSYARTTSRTITSNAGWWSSSINTSNAANANTATFNGKQYVAYAAYTPGVGSGISLRLASTNLTTGVTTIYNPGLPTWSTSDEHNNPSIQLDKNGYIHLTYDMHTTPLIYYRSTNPEDPSAFTGPLSMLGGANETGITFGSFFKNVADGELYYTFQKGGGASGFQYFYKYNASTQTWGAPTGTTLGQIIGGTRTSFLNGLPQWYDGVLWFSFLLASADGLTVEPNQFLIGWNGTSFIKWGGSAQTIPATAANLTAVFAGGTSLFLNSNGFSIDTNGRACLPMTYADGGGLSQMYVACGSGGGAFTGYQLTTNTIPYKPPNPELYGSQGGEGGAVKPQSPSIVALGSCTYFTYPDVFRQRGGQKIHQSCNGFATFSTYLLMTNYNPNWVFAWDFQQLAAGKVSFFFQNTNDPDFQQSYLTNFSSNLGLIQVIDWVPQPASGISGNTAIRGGAILR